MISHILGGKTYNVDGDSLCLSQLMCPHTDNMRRQNLDSIGSMNQYTVIGNTSQKNLIETDAIKNSKEPYGGCGSLFIFFICNISSYK